MVGQARTDKFSIKSGGWFPGLLETWLQPPASFLYLAEGNNRTDK
jgi:hypothetical protein